MAVHPLRGLSICAGIGGIDLGLRRALGDAYVTACYIEQEVTSAAVLAARIEDKQLCAAPIWSNLHTFDPDPWAGHIDIVSAGIPCQPWSVAGRQRGHQDKRHLWAPTYVLLKRLRPTFFFLENVPGIVSGNGLEPIWRDLCALGYGVEGGFFTAASLGAPHVRKRFFLLAYADGCGQRARQPINLEVKDACITRRRQQGARDTSGIRTALAEANGGEKITACCRQVANAPCRRCKNRQPCVQDVGPRPKSEGSGFGCKRQGRVNATAAIESRVGAVVDGISEGLDQRQWSEEWEQDCPRVSVKVPERNSQLACLGNAVVPAVAAYAFAYLIKRFGDAP